MARTLKDIKKEKSDLQDQIMELQERLENLNEEKEAIKYKSFFKLVKGTNWFLPKNYMCLVYSNSGNSKDSLSTYVCDDMGLYPHGRVAIAPNVILCCDDGKLELSVNPSIKETKKFAYDHTAHLHMSYKKLFDFAKECGIVVDLKDKEADIAFHASKVVELTQELEFLKSLK